MSKMMGQEFSEFNNQAQCGIAELGNLITGRASIKLSQTGFESNISPPTMLLCSGDHVSTLDLPRLVVPLMGEPGDITIHLAIRGVS